MPQEEAVEMRLTDEIRAKLKGCLGFQVDARFKYVQKAFRDSDIDREMWTVWTLKSKDGVRAAQVEDNAGYLEMDGGGGNSKFRPQSGSMRLQTLRDGVVGVEQFWLEDGGALSWDDKTQDMVVRDPEGKERTRNNIKVDAIIKHMPVATQVELQNAINERETLTPEELRGLE